MKRDEAVLALRMSTPRLGRYGEYLFVQDFQTPSLASRVKGLEEIGYGTVWSAGNAPGDLHIPEALPAESDSITVGTAIVHVWAEDADLVAEAFHRVDGRHPGRFVLGVGIGHREMSGDVYQKPFPALTKYVERLLELGVPCAQIILAALRSMVMELSRDKRRTALFHDGRPHLEGASDARAELTLAVVQLVARTMIPT